MGVPPLTLHVYFAPNSAKGTSFKAAERSLTGHGRRRPQRWDHGNKADETRNPNLE